jgi:hypothetical protein
MKYNKVSAAIINNLNKAQISLSSHARVHVALDREHD